MKTSDLTLDAIGKVLIRCFWMAIAFQVLWFVFYLVGGDWAYEFHSHLWLDVTRHEFALINIYGLTFFKLCAFGAFLMPYLAIRMVLSRSSSGEAAEVH